MQSRTKPLDIIDPENVVNRIKTTNLENPPSKKECKLVEGENVKELIALLQNEAKVI